MDVGRYICIHILLYKENRKVERRPISMPTRFTVFTDTNTSTSTIHDMTNTLLAFTAGMHLLMRSIKICSDTLPKHNHSRSYSNT